ncbi:MAG: hypothetical protein ABH829_03335 [archaeon]
MANWRDAIPEDTNEHINELIRRIGQYSEGYNQSPHVRTSQLWCALAEVMKDLKQTQQRLAQTEYQLNQMKSALRKSGEMLSKS